MNETIVELIDSNRGHVEAYESRFDDVQDGQWPVAVTVCCSDSRVLKDHVWGNDEPGRLFTVANVGNRVVQRTAAGEVVSGDALYPVEHTGTDTIVVTGHTGCGAVTAAYDHLTGGIDEPPGIAHCVELLASRLGAGVEALPSDVDRTDAVNRLVEYNVDQQVAFLLESDDVPTDVDVVGVVYDFQDVYPGRRGEVHVVNVGGEADVSVLREDHPELAPRIHRIWKY